MSMKKRTQVVVVAVALAVGAAGANAAPKIEFDRTVYDFGTTAAVTSVSGIFKIKNVGDTQLEISKPSTSCGCTVAGVKPDKLQPGETAELSFTLNVGSRQGAVSKSIIVPSNDPEQSRVNLSVRVDVKKVFEINPERVMLGDVRASTQTNFVVTVKHADNEPLTIQRLEVKGPRLKAELKPDADDQARAEIHIAAAKIGRAPRLNSSHSSVSRMPSSA